MKTVAERAFDKGKLKRPTDWAPNGCGPAAFGRFDPVPDELDGVNFGYCCNEHDLAYYQGGFLGLFYKKPRADVGLSACMASRFYTSAWVDWKMGGAKRKAKAVGKALIGTVAAPVYFTFVTVFGWTPLTWSWRQKSPPSDEDIEAVCQAMKQ